MHCLQYQDENAPQQGDCSTEQGGAGAPSGFCRSLTIRSSLVVRAACVGGSGASNAVCPCSLVRVRLVLLSVMDLSRVGATLLCAATRKGPEAGQQQQRSSCG